MDDRAGVDGSLLWCACGAPQVTPELLRTHFEHAFKLLHEIHLLWCKRML